MAKVIRLGRPFYVRFVLGFIAVVLIVLAVLPSDHCIPGEQPGYKDCRTHSQLYELYLDLRAFDFKVLTDLGMLFFTAVLAWFTFSLAVSTKRLWRESIAQRRLNNRALRVASASAKEAERASDIAEATLEATNRPWIMITGAEQDTTVQGPVIRDGLFFMPVSISIKNVGNSPAVNIKSFVVALFNYEGNRNISDILREWAQPVAEAWVEWDKGETLFHDDSTKLPQNGGVRIPAGVSVNESTWHLLVGVAYVFPFSKPEIRYTANLYRVIRNNAFPICLVPCDSIAQRVWRLSAARDAMKELYQPLGA